MTTLYPSFISGNIVTFLLPDGAGFFELFFPYSFKRIHSMQSISGISFWKGKDGQEVDSKANNLVLSNYTFMEFPVVNGYSPNTLNIHRGSTATAVRLTFIVDEIGGKPSKDYWLYSLDSLSGFPNSEIDDVKFNVQPQDVTVTNGQAFSLSVSCTGVELTYDWEYSDNNGKDWIPSRSGNPINFIGSASFDNRLIRCKVTNIYGTKYYSEPAIITMLAPQSDEDVEDNEE